MMKQMQRSWGVGVPGGKSKCTGREVGTSSTCPSCQAGVAGVSEQMKGKWWEVEPEGSLGPHGRESCRPQ